MKDEHRVSTAAPGAARAPGAPGDEPAAAVRTRVLRAPWTAVCAAVAVVLGPAAVTASALDLANAAPPHPAVRADQAPAYLPSDTRRRATA
ncbi:hypothetical protein ACIQU5_30190 [Streptomyces sp. NPDC090306]|uniref:hypothetical protein n=1 Tax=Streptomyces sp. NPDC090306 TaxID=3365961 RepID=UPI0038284994